MAEMLVEALDSALRGWFGCDSYSPRMTSRPHGFCRCGEGSDIPHYLRYAITGDRETRLALSRATRNAYRAVVEPYWADNRANHQVELVRQGRIMARHGVRVALSTME